jgi:peptidoglycan L-alanyl-D-glutamate endopeptidase CwlK
VPITLSAKSLQRLDGAHPDLVKVVKRAAALSSLDFTVLEVLRTLERQKQLVAKGASKTMRSRHLPHPGDGKSRAVDIAPVIDGQVSWDWPLYHKLAVTVKQAASEVGVPIEWGGDWTDFKDGPHWQLPWGAYP